MVIKRENILPKLLENLADISAPKPTHFDPFGPILTQEHNALLYNFIKQSPLRLSFNIGAAADEDEKKRQEREKIYFALQLQELVMPVEPMPPGDGLKDIRDGRLVVIGEPREVVTSEFSTNAPPEPGDKDADDYNGEATSETLKFDDGSSVAYDETIRDKDKKIISGNDPQTSETAKAEDDASSNLSEKFQNAAANSTPASPPSIIDLVIASLPPPYTPPVQKLKT